MGWEDPLEKGMAAHSSIRAWRISWMYSPWGRKELDMTERLSLKKSICKSVCCMSEWMDAWMHECLGLGLCSFTVLDTLGTLLI